MSREKKFTTGPWIHNDRYADSAGDIVDQNNFSFIDVCNYSIKMDTLENEHWANSPDYHKEISPDEQRANANLIAAAPELLELAELTCKKCSAEKELYDAMNGCNKAKEDCHACSFYYAINKAYGE